MKLILLVSALAATASARYFTCSSDPTPSPCPNGMGCHDIEADATCDVTAPGATCGGICLGTDFPRCGGFAGLTCPEEYSCYQCDPQKAGNDCFGTCLLKNA